MPRDWTQGDIEQMIADKIEESLELDYKAAASLARSDGKKKEMTKDVSAMANAAGGLIIYGVAEDQQDRHLPAGIDPVSREAFSKEWVEQVLGTIQPRIDNLIIHSVQLDSGDDDVVYIVEVPQSTTAHQARDHRYYRRYNFESVPMTDYEIRDVMARGQHPRVEVRFRIRIETVSISDFPMGMGPANRYEDRMFLEVRAFNDGRVLAEYVNCFLDIPSVILTDYHTEFLPQEQIDGVIYSGTSLQNTHRDVVDHNMGYPKHGPSRFQPILPGLGFGLNDYRLADSALENGDLILRWKVHSDNAPPLEGTTRLGDIEVDDQRPAQDAA